VSAFVEEFGQPSSSRSVQGQCNATGKDNSRKKKEMKLTMFDETDTPERGKDPGPEQAGDGHKPHITETWDTTGPHRRRRPTEPRTRVADARSQSDDARDGDRLPQEVETDEVLALPTEVRDLGTRRTGFQVRVVDVSLHFGHVLDWKKENGLLSRLWE
jgi:hypothetical protein